MKFVTLLKYSLVLTAVILLNSVSHVSAIASMPTHEMGGMNHSARDSGACASLCRTAVVSRDTNDVNRPDNEDDEHKPALAFYAINQIEQISEKVEKMRLYGDTVKPPPRLPGYILHSVFRV